MSYLDDNPSAACPWSNCQCTHIGCTAGFIDRTRDDGTRPDGTPMRKDYVEICATCRPEVARHLGDRRKPLRTLRRELPTLPRPTRGPARLHTAEEPR
ncbi:hypothetical protein GCM10010402_66330 [Actinomadura luteofluorescens]|uniref:hypothetical protein n=1 Tax=Actinomadura luteofluorescens TaxID=46163 RepID=UPI002164CFA6|nr:hypothetical protein [Actinomadura glauciflava]MCR3744195.1 hypothetical protein [Actinomadura glauciflava]